VVKTHPHKLKIQHQCNRQHSQTSNYKSDVKPAATATGPQLTYIFGGSKCLQLVVTYKKKVLLLSKHFWNVRGGARLSPPRVAIAGLNNYEYSTASSVLQCNAKICNCLSAQWWNCAVCGIRAIHSSCSLRDLQLS